MAGVGDTNVEEFGERERERDEGNGFQGAHEKLDYLLPSLVGEILSTTAMDMRT